MDDTQAFPPIQKILVTGGCGRIGSDFIKSNAGRYTFRAMDRIAWDRDKHGDFPGEASVADLQDLEVCRRACQGMEAVIHLAADPNPAAEFASLLPNNIITPYNMFTAAAEAGCRRFIFASSLHAIEGYPPEKEVSIDMPIWPKNLYGVTKCFGEALGIYFAYHQGLPTLAVRIGTYWPRDRHFTPSERDKRSYVSADDLNQVLVKCLEATGIQFAIVHANSNNRFKRLDISATICDFGYQPQADAFAIY
jgi:nucleoside-diphosphate-sugar epimerase